MLPIIQAMYIGNPSKVNLYWHIIAIMLRNSGQKMSETELAVDVLQQQEDVRLHAAGLCSEAVELYPGERPGACKF